jgi:hypothetical protein
MTDDDRKRITSSATPAVRKGARLAVAGGWRPEDRRVCEAEARPFIIRHPLSMRRDGGMTVRSRWIGFCEPSPRA